MGRPKGSKNKSKKNNLILQTDSLPANDSIPKIIELIKTLGKEEFENQTKQAFINLQKKPKYKIIYADPPWSYKDKLGTDLATMGGYDKYYKGMPLNNICQLPISKICDKDCILFLWATMPLLQDAFKVIDSWGFTYKTVAFTWVKQNLKADTIFKGVGRWVQGNAELVFLATKGKPHRINKDVSQIVLEHRQGHSVKPKKVRDNIVHLMGDIPRIELFARQKTEGWDIIEGKDDADGIGNDIVNWINQNYGEL